MTDIIFVKTRTHYDSYQHFWKLVELSGFPWVYPEQIDLGSSSIYILTPLNGEFPNSLPARNCKIIWGNFERPSHYNTYKFDRHDFDDILVCDREWAERTGTRFFTMGSHPDLGYYNPEKRWDIATNCYETPRRTAIFNELRGQYSFAPNSFNQPDHELAASRLILLPQQDDPPHCLTPLRFCIAAAYKLPMIYEAQGCCCEPFVQGADFFEYNYQDLAPATKKWLKEGDIQFVGDQLHDKLCIQTNFRKSIEDLF